jgi:hypothetical protein
LNYFIIIFRVDIVEVFITNKFIIFSLWTQLTIIASILTWQVIDTIKCTGIGRGELIHQLATLLIILIILIILSGKFLPSFPSFSTSEMDIARLIHESLKGASVCKTFSTYLCYSWMAVCP